MQKTAHVLIAAAFMAASIVGASAGGNKPVCVAMRQHYDLCVKNYGLNNPLPAHHCKTWLAQMKAGGCL